MLLMDQIAENARLVIAHGAAPHPEMRTAIEIAMGKRNATQADVDAAARQGSKRVLDTLSKSARFVVERGMTDMLLPMIDQPTRLLASAKHLFAPAENSWFELVTPDGRVGLIITCKQDSLTAGGGAVYIPTQTEQHVAVPIDWNLADPKSLVDWMGGNRDYLERAINVQAGKPVSVNLNRIGLLLLALLAVLCTPRLWVAREIDRGKLNRARARRGRWPLFAYKEVVIDPRRVSTVSPASGHGSPRALHFVRAHLRVRSNGRVEMVRPHWRGDAQLGIKRPAYRLTVDGR